MECRDDRGFYNLCKFCGFIEHRGYKEYKENFDKFRWLDTDPAKGKG